MQDVKYNSKINHRQSTRLQNYNYSQNGYYFVTICVKDKIEYFGKIKNSKMILNEIGKIANKYWLEIPNHFPNVKLDEHIIMPNHLHGIVIIENGDFVGAQDFVSVRVQDFEPLRENKFQHIIPKSLESIIRGFKIGITKWCRNNNHEFIWQRNYYEHVIRDGNELNRIRKYIIENPLKWELDRNNLENLYM